jgi:hypothetical protein
MPNNHTVNLRYGEEKVVTSAKFRQLGTRGVTPDNRVFYYCQAGGTALTANTLIQAKATETQANLNLTPSTSTGDWSGTNIPTGSASIGVVWVTNHASGEFSDGYMTVETTPGTGTYRIASDGDTATGSSNTVNIIRLHPDDTIQSAALTTTSKLAFHHNPYASVIAPAAALTNIIVGVPNVAVALDNYFWIQTYGEASVLYNSLVAAVVGNEVLAGTTAGTGAVGAPSGTVITATIGLGFLASRPVIGWAMDGIPDTTDSMKVMLSIRS